MRRYWKVVKPWGLPCDYTKRLVRGSRKGAFFEESGIFLYIEGYCIFQIEVCENGCGKRSEGIKGAILWAG